MPEVKTSVSLPRRSVTKLAPSRVSLRHPAHILSFLALLRIDGAGSFDAITVGDPNRVRMGDEVLDPPIEPL